MSADANRAARTVLDETLLPDTVLDEDTASAPALDETIIDETVFDETFIDDDPTPARTDLTVVDGTEPDHTIAHDAMPDGLQPSLNEQNPVLQKLLKQAAARRSGQELKFLTEMPMDLDSANLPNASVSVTVPVEELQAPASPAASQVAVPQPDTMLRGIARKLAQDGVIQERRAVSIALKAKEAGVSFMRMLARDRMAGDLLGIYRAVSERLGTGLITDKTSLFPRMGYETWLSAQLADRFEILPLINDDEQDTVFRYATVDPFDVAVRDWVQRRSGAREVQAVPALPEVMLDGLGRYRALGAENRDQSAMFVPLDVDWSEKGTDTSEIGNWDIPMVVNYALYKAHEMSASDVHFEPTGDSLVVRNRVDGVLQEELRLPAAMQAPIIARVKVLANLDVAERRLPQDGRISVSLRDQPIDIRVSTLPTVTGEKIVMRLLDESALRPRPESLGLSDHDLRLLLDRINAPHGMIMLSGPTGSGKTTTLYSCLSSIDRVARNVVTIEDPVEYRLKGVHQTQVNDSIGMTFASGLRTILRQDPDVIMVGECRDQETAHMAVQASLTGHLVFSTIHANDAPGVVNRLLDMGIEPFLIANALSLVIAQRLIRVHCEHCITTMDGQEILAGLRAEGVSAAKLDRLGIHIEPDLPYAATEGCAHCRHTGYAGRQAVHEQFAMTDELRAEILNERFEMARFRSIAREAGMLSMIENAVYLVEEGRTSFSEVVRVLGDN